MDGFTEQLCLTLEHLCGAFDDAHAPRSVALGGHHPIHNHR